MENSSERCAQICFSGDFGYSTKAQKKTRRIDDNPDADFQEMFAELGMVAHQQNTSKPRQPNALTDTQKKQAELVALFQSVGISNQG